MIVAGHLQQKAGHWYAVITYKQNGKATSKWFSTGLKIKGNKKRAEEFLLLKRLEFSNIGIAKNKKPISEKIKENDITLLELCEKWVKYIKPQVSGTTYEGYMVIIRNHIRPYLKKHKIYVKEVTSAYVQGYINYAYDRGLSNKTISNHRGVLSGIFKYGITLNLIEYDPMNKLPAIRKSPVIENYYDAEEAIALMESCKKTMLEYPVTMACIYGLRRSEICGLRWDAIDFKNGIFTIKHTLVEIPDEEGHIQIVGRDETKNKKNKSFPLLKDIEKLLLSIKETQEKNQTFNARGYVYLDSKGNVVRPNYVSETFQLHIKKQGFKKIRFHDLRHSCASILLADPNRSVSLKDIQLWLGHSDIKSTMRYAHLSDVSAKAHTAGLIENMLLSEDDIKTG